MSFRRLALVFQRDFYHNVRRPMFWIWIGLLLLMAWGLSSGGVRIQSGDSSVGGTKAHITSEFAVAQLLTIFTSLIYGFFIAVAAGMSVIHDEECRVGEVLHATSLRPSEYIWGKFLAIIGCILAVLTIHLAAMILFNHIMPAGTTREFRGAFHLANYLRPALVFSLPTAIFFAGASFALGELTRRPILVFFLPVAVFLGSIFFLWDYAPTWLPQWLDRVMMIVDPAGFRWLSEGQLKVDRGVAFYNTSSIPLDATLIANRVLFLALGFGAVVFSQWHFRASLRGESKQANKAWKRQGKDLAPATTLSGVELTPPKPLGALAMIGRAPGFLAGAWTVARAEIVELLSSPGLYLFVPLLILEATGPNLIALGAFDTPLLLTSGTIAVRSYNALVVMVCLLLLFYTVESLWRERHTRLAAIGFATPIRTGSILTGKALANSLVGVAVITLQFLASAAILLFQGKVGIELIPFALIWGLLLIPTLLLWTSFVMATLAITRNRYATYGIAIFVIGFTGYRQIKGEINWVGNWPLWNALTWSDISVLELDRSALILNRVLALGLAVFFIALTAKFYARREQDAAAIVHRLQPWPLFKAALWLLPVALVPIVSGVVLWAKVDNGFQGENAKKLEKDYWRKNIATYRDWPLPDITSTEVSADIDPAKSKIHVKGTFELINNQDKPLREIPVSGALHWDEPKWTFNGKSVTPKNRSHLYVFTPETPIEPGGKFQIGFELTGVFPSGITKRGGGTNEFILPSGVVLTSFGTSFVPNLGFSEAVGVDKENQYDSREYPDDYYEGQTDSFAGSRRPYKTKVTISGPAEFTYNSVGVQTRDDVKDGTRTTVWQSDQPVNFFNIVAGDWQVKRGDGTAVYYNKKHAYNVDEMVEALNAARKYYSEWFFPFPWKELKLSEFPALATYAQGFPTDITFSESIGFLTDSDPGANSAFMVTAHESAHQWWGNIVAPGKGPGGNLLSEGTSHFSTLLLFEKVKGLYPRMEFAKKIEDSYAKARSSDSERPLVKTDGTRDGDQTVTYDKTGWVLWMLMQNMGRDRMLAGIQEFFKEYRDNPDHPVLQDFLAILRKHAENPEAFDEFTQQWFYKVVVPEYQISEAKVTEDGKKWVVKAKVTNVGTGKMPVEFAASAGERFEKEGNRAVSKDYREARTTVTLGREESKEITMTCDFKPDQVVADPDAKVLQLRRKAAVAKL